MTLIIIAITVIVSISCFNNKEMYFKSVFSPYIISQRNEWYRFITHMFIHADYNHLFFNMFTAYFFIPFANNLIGSDIIFLAFYLSAGVISSIPDYLKNRDNMNYNAVGASGAISAVLFFFIYFNPFHQIIVFIFPMPSIVFAVLYLGYSYYMSKRNLDNVGHMAHFTGAVYGLSVAYIFEFIGFL
jgi:membrane associated rhomboid family serine protease